PSGQSARLVVLAQHALRARRGRGGGFVGHGLHQGRFAHARILDRSVRAWLWFVWHDAFAMDGRDGISPRPWLRPRRRRGRAQLVRGISQRRRLWRGKMDPARSRHLDGDLRADRKNAPVHSRGEGRREALDRPEIFPAETEWLARVRPRRRRWRCLSPIHDGGISGRLRRAAAHGAFAAWRNIAALPATGAGGWTDVCFLG